MPTTGTVVVMIAFTMMAVGLNIVVGYCGLLDLGYVAFYAVGAYTAGWFASQHFEQVTFHFGSSVDNDQVGIHVTMWVVLIIAGSADDARRASSSACRRSGCEATTSRSSRSASARSSRRSCGTATASAAST